MTTEPKFFVPNKKVACAPLGKYRAVQMTGNTFKTAVQKGALLELSVVFSSGDYKKGDTVYIKGNCITLDWTKEEFTAESVPFILVPEDRIELQVSLGPTSEDRVEPIQKADEQNQGSCFASNTSCSDGGSTISSTCCKFVGTTNSTLIPSRRCGCSNGCANPRCSSM